MTTGTKIAAGALGLVGAYLFIKFAGPSVATGTVIPPGGSAGGWLNPTNLSGIVNGLGQVVSSTGKVLGVIPGGTGSTTTAGTIQYAPGATNVPSPPTAPAAAAGVTANSVSPSGYSDANGNAVNADGTPYVAPSSNVIDTTGSDLDNTDGTFGMSGLNQRWASWGAGVSGSKIGAGL